MSVKMKTRRGEWVYVDTSRGLHGAKPGDQVELAQFRNNTGVVVGVGPWPIAGQERLWLKIEGEGITFVDGPRDFHILEKQE